MKKFYIIIIIIIFSDILFAQITNVSYNDIFSTDSSSAWIVGDDGTILRIMDGGASFEDHSFPTQLNLQSIYFVDEQKGFIVGDSGIVLHSNDGGSNWNILNLGVSTDLGTVSFVDNQHGWITANRMMGPNFGQALFRTTDGGESWTFYNYFVYCTFFLDSINGWGYGSNLSILRTYDGGVNWSILSSYPGTGAMKFYFQDTLTGFYYGHAYGNSFSRRSDDGGATWSPANLGDEGMELMDLCFLDTLNGWVCGTHRIFYSNDLFETYDTFIPSGPAWFNSLSIHGSSNGWAVSYDLVSEQGSIWKLDGINSWIQLNIVGIQEVNNSISGIKCFPNPFREIVTIELEINIKSNIKISIHNQLGKEIESLYEGNKDKGIFHLIWNPANLTAGIYFIKFESDQGITSRKILKR